MIFRYASKFQAASKRRIIKHALCNNTIELSDSVCLIPLNKAGRALERGGGWQPARKHPEEVRTIWINKI